MKGCTDGVKSSLYHQVCTQRDHDKNEMIQIQKKLIHLQNQNQTMQCRIQQETQASHGMQSELEQVQTKLASARLHFFFLLVYCSDLLLLYMFLHMK